MKSKVTKEEFLKFHELANSDLSLINAFNNFELSVTGEDLLKEGFVPGSELGKEIKKREINNFILLLS